jgi:hypothetical protein
MDEAHLIPEMDQRLLSGGDVPDGFMLRPRPNYAFLVFPSAAAVPIDEYAPKIAFQRWDLASTDTGATRWGRAGGTPEWMLHDESPGLYMGRNPLRFLLQIDQDVVFPVLDSTPGQVELDMLNSTPGALRRSEDRHYELFVGNAVYLFGTENPADGVYCVVQSD